MKKIRTRTIEQKISRRTWISFSVFTVMSAAFAGGWKWLLGSGKETAGATAGLRAPSRAVLNGNEKILRKVFSDRHLVKTYPASMAAKKVRINGTIGMMDKKDVDNWRLNVIKNNGEVLMLTLNQLRILPKTEITYDFKCVEGWDQISHWGGVKFSDLISHYKLDAEAAMEYVSLVTPDGDYYVGIDMPGALHPQTLLCYEVNGGPLPFIHGYPLRLIIPVKYGIKNLKRIGTISFSNERPADYWAERGYDYYSGL